MIRCFKTVVQRPVCYSSSFPNRLTKSPPKILGSMNSRNGIHTSRTIKAPSKFPSPPDIKLGRSTKTNTTTNKNPGENINTIGNTILHQKAARAAELHAELDALLDMQARRRADDLQNSNIFTSFFDFIKKSKSEMINIFAAFFCVLLAWQIASIRRGARKLLDESGEREVKMEELRSVLRTLCEDDFVDGVVEDYGRRLKEQMDGSSTEEKDSSSGLSSSSWFSKIIKKTNTDTVNSTQSVNDEELQVLKMAIQEQLKSMIGDIALSEVELAEKKLAELQKEMGIRDTTNGRSISLSKSTTSTTVNSQNSTSSSINGIPTSDNKGNGSKTALDGLDQILLDAIETKEDNGEGSNKSNTVVKSRKGFI